MSAAEIIMVIALAVFLLLEFICILTSKGEDDDL